MNIYSDIGNIICLKKRCQWRGIEVKVVPVGIGQKFDWQKYDLVFGGGGQDRQQEIVSRDLQKKKKEILSFIHLTGTSQSELMEIQIHMLLLLHRKLSLQWLLPVI